MLFRDAGTAVGTTPQEGLWQAALATGMKMVP